MTEFVLDYNAFALNKNLKDFTKDKMPTYNFESIH